MNLLYLDYNCYQRVFDDMSQIKIQMEALACQEIFNRAQADLVQLAWSFMLEDEKILCPFPERKYETERLLELCKIRLGPKYEILPLAKSFQARERLSAKDAIHFACAVYIKASYFISCDGQLNKQANRLNVGIKALNPIDYLRQEELQ